MENKRVKKSRHAQVTIFVILGIAIVAVIILLFLPNIRKIITPLGPNAQIKECIEESISPLIEEEIINAGLEEDSLYYMHQGERYNYLCYTGEFYEKCIMQQPMLMQTIEKQIKQKSEERIRSCILNVKNDFKKKGYLINQEGDSKINLRMVPENILVSVNSQLTLQKQDSEEVIQINIPSSEIYTESYDLIMISSSILNWEARYGDAPTDVYMGNYPDIKIEKYRQSEGTTLYIITHRKSEERIKFAARSLAMPAGFG
jgi:hypothetical protein